MKRTGAVNGRSPAFLEEQFLHEGTTPSNLNQKVKRNTITKEEMERIATALGGMWRAEFVFEDGTVI